MGWTGRRRGQQSQRAETHHGSRAPSRGRGFSTQHLSPASSKFEPITLERGITFAAEFRAWATLVYNHEGDGAVSLKNFRKNITIEMLNLQGIS